MISVIVLTFDDEAQIGRCLGSVAGLSDDIIVVDSYSRDCTVEICRRLGARVFQHPFVNQALQFNWALDTVPIANGWVLRLDADEVVPERLADEIRVRLGSEPGVVAYALNRRMVWQGRWLRHGRMYPHRIVRLFRQGRARYEERTEEHLIVDGTVAAMRCDFFEDNRKNSLDHFMRKHLATAAGEASEALGTAAPSPGIAARLTGGKAHRTRWLKERLYLRTPLFLRPFLYFVYRYVVCLGFLDGVPGLTFHVLQGFWYRFYIDALIHEERTRRRAGFGSRPP